MFKILQLKQAGIYDHRVRLQVRMGAGIDINADGQAERFETPEDESQRFKNSLIPGSVACS